MISIWVVSCVIWAIYIDVLGRVFLCVFGLFHVLLACFMCYLGGHIIVIHTYLHNYSYSFVIWAVSCVIGQIHVYLGCLMCIWADSCIWAVYIDVYLGCLYVLGRLY